VEGGEVYERAASFAAGAGTIRFSAWCSNRLTYSCKITCRVSASLLAWLYIWLLFPVPPCSNNTGVCREEFLPKVVYHRSTPDDRLRYWPLSPLASGPGFGHHSQRGTEAL